MDIVFKETKKLILPCTIMAVLAFIGFAIFGFYTINIALCILFGTVYSLVNYIMIGASLYIALTKGERQANAYMTGSYILRFVVLGAIIYYTLMIPEINTFAVVLPLFFPKITLVLGASLGFYNKDN